MRVAEFWMMAGLTVLVPVQRVRYTHGSANEESVHGPNKGRNREEVVTRLKASARYNCTLEHISC